MKEIKIKLKEEKGEIKLCFMQNKKVISTETRYINRCIICKKTTINEQNFGEKHICPECLEIIKTDFAGEFAKSKRNTKEKRTATKNTKEEANKENAPKQKREISMFARSYKPSISLVDYVKYKNLMLKPLSEDLVTMMIDLILRGINTAEKIANTIKFRRVETIYTYLTMLVKVGILCPVGTLTKKTRLTRLYRVNSSLEYANI